MALLKHKYIVLHRMNLSPAIFRVDRIIDIQPKGTHSVVRYGDGKEHEVKENIAVIGWKGKDKWAAF